MKQLSVFLFVILLSSCVRIKSGGPWKIEGATEVTLELNTEEGDSLHWKAAGTITDPELVRRFCDEINDASKDGLWKGVGWHKIRIWKGDAIWDFYTNGKVFGEGMTGDFYKFSKSNNILKDYFGIDTP